MRKWAIAAIAIVAVALIAVGIVWAIMPSWAPPAPSPAPSTTSTTPPPSTSAPIEYAVALTDPPEVPYGTSSILLNYTGVAVHTTEGTWYSNASASGSVDLMALQNLSVVIADVRVPANATVNVVRLYISNATIVINGTSYPLLLPSGELTIPIINASRAQGALVDLQPRVTIAYVGDQPVYIMAPAAVAVPLNFTAPPGHTFAVPKHVRDELERFRANLVITSASISVSGNVTTITITVKNEGNETVEIYGVRVHGPWSINVPPITVSNEYFSMRVVVENFTVNSSLIFPANGTQLMPPVWSLGHFDEEHEFHKLAVLGGAAKASFSVNWTAVREHPPPFPVNISQLQEEANESETQYDEIIHEGLEQVPAPPSMQTLRSQNVSMPQFWGAPGDDDEANATPIMPPALIRPLTLAPGQSATLTFSGAIAVEAPWGGSNPEAIVFTPIAGDSYLITIMSVPSSNATTIVMAG